MFQGKSDEALESHLIDLRAQNAELITSGNFASSDVMQSALAAALRLASMLSSSQSQDTIQQAMAVLDSVNKKLYGMIDQSAAAKSSAPDPPTASSSSQGQGQGQGQGQVQSTTSKSLVGYGDDDDDDFQAPGGYGYGNAATKRSSTSPTRSHGTLGASTSGAGPTKRFHFGL